MELSGEKAIDAFGIQFSYRGSGFPEPLYKLDTHFEEENRKT